MDKLYTTLLNTDQYQQLFSQWGWLMILIAIWSVVWKGVALWHSARNSQKAWFVVLLVVNTVGILEIIYLLGFKKPRAS
jgi:methionyl-tRNA synthetase